MPFKCSDVEWNHKNDLQLNGLFKEDRMSHSIDWASVDNEATSSGRTEQLDLAEWCEEDSHGSFKPRFGDFGKVEFALLKLYRFAFQ